MRLKHHREISKSYKIKFVTLAESNGNYYVSILTEFEKKIKRVLSKNSAAVSDFSMSKFFVSSEN